jgi:hypothetical protein
MSVMGINWQPNRTAYPNVGDAYYDVNIGGAMIWDGATWIQISKDSTISQGKSLVPSEENLEKYPALKQAWEEYLVVKRLLGV